MYKDWIRAQLPEGIPEDIIDRAVSHRGGYLSGLQFWVYGERGPDRLEYEGADEEDLRLWLFGQAAREIAQSMELRGRSEEEKRWRFVRDHVEQGAWIYRENGQYEYDAICDTRKYWMEYELRLLYPVFPAERWRQRIAYYEACMNRSFLVEHWRYDVAALCFVEVSGSKEVDWNGVEQPAEGTVMETGGLPGGEKDRGRLNSELFGEDLRGDLR